MTAPTMDVLKALFDRATLQRGLNYASARKVAEIQTSENGNIFAVVRGSQNQRYKVQIDLRQHGGARPTIRTECTCPVEDLCKHAAAVLVHLAAAQISLPDAGRGAAGTGRGFTPVPPPPVRIDARGAEAPALAKPGPAAVPAATPEPLDSRLTSWLDDVKAAAASPEVRNGYAATVKQRIAYVMLVDPLRRAHGRTPPMLAPVVVPVLKAGGFGSPLRGIDIDRVLTVGEVPKYARPIDMEIFRLATLMRRDSVDRRATVAAVSTDGIPLIETAVTDRLLERVLETGRCRWLATTGPVLRMGPSRPAVARWQCDEDGRQRLVFGPLAADEASRQASPPAFDVVLPVNPPYYVDSSIGEVGPLALDMPPALAARIADMPAVHAAEAAAFGRTLQEALGPDAAAHLVPEQMTIATIEVRKVAPIPRLVWFMGEVRVLPPASWYVRDPRYHSPVRVPLARLELDYGGQTILPSAEGRMLERYRDGKLIQMPRNAAAEKAAAHRLAEAGLHTLASLSLGRTDHTRGDRTLTPRRTPNVDANEILPFLESSAPFVAFSANEVPALVAEGWQVAFSDDYPYHVAEGEIGWWADAPSEGSGIDWFSFELGVEFEGARISLVPMLVELLSKLEPGIAALGLSGAPEDVRTFDGEFKGKTLLHRLPDGRLLPLPGDRIAPMLRAVLELVGPRQVTIKDGRLRLPRAEAAALADLRDHLGETVAWAASADRLVGLGRDLRRGRGPVPVAPPESFKATLRPYQSDGLAWLDFLRETGFGGVLADDMGLGKTVQALAFLAREKAEGRLDKPALILAPTSVLPNWRAEAARFTPDLSVLSLTRGAERQALHADIPHHDLVLTTYPILMRDHAVLLEQEFHVAILDEAQAIKNPKATVSGLAHRIRARHRLALTGTPLENNLGEVWSLFEYLSPGLLGDEATFRRTFRTPIEKYGDTAAQSFLTRRLKPFMLRRTKAQVATELPPKTEIVERVQLEGAQRDLYETVRALMHERVREEIDRKGLAKSHIVFLDALLKLRQVCCDPRLLKMPHARKVKGSAKLERLMELLPEMVAEGRRVLLFSQFTSMLDLIAAELHTAKIPFVELTGQTVDRGAPVAAFQSGKVPLFLLSLKAGGTGLNLTAADTVIHYDPWWNPAVENQATDRAYRIGQDKPVFVHKLIVEGSIEEAIEQLKARKAALAEALFEGASRTGLDLTENDIAALFAPLDHRPEKPRTERVAA